MLMVKGWEISCSRCQWFSRIRKAETDEGLYSKHVQVLYKSTLCKTLFMCSLEKCHIVVLWV